MKGFCNKTLILVAFISLLLLILPVFGACVSTELPRPPPLELKPPPPELSLEKIYAEYVADTKVADNNYGGQRFLFQGVKIDKVSSYFLNSRAVDISLVSGNVKFLPRYKTDIDRILPGFVVQIAGEPWGLFLDNILVIGDCWVKVTEGDIGDVKPETY